MSNRRSYVRAQDVCKLTFSLGGSFFIQVSICSVGGVKNSVYFWKEKHDTLILSVSQPDQEERKRKHVCKLTRYQAGLGLVSSLLFFFSSLFHLDLHLDLCLFLSIS